MHTPDTAAANIRKIADLFPDCVTEATGEDGATTLKVDFDALRQHLSAAIVEGPQERYRLDWPGKRRALAIANAPTALTLRPCRTESVGFDTTRNLFVEGDNLDALKLLKQAYTGRIRMIYIDPPYNTGRDCIHKDDFAQDRREYLLHSAGDDEDGSRLAANPEMDGRFHSDWLSMMYARLSIARTLLSDDGIIMISIDEKEHANLKKVCDEIFGARNFCGEIVWKNSSKNDQAYISVQHEYFVVYARDRSANPGNWTERKQGLDAIYEAFDGFANEHGPHRERIHAAAVQWYNLFPASDPINQKKHYAWMDENGVYFASDLSGPSTGQYVYDIVHPATGMTCKSPPSGWRYPQAEMTARIAEGRVHFGTDHTTIPRNKTYLKDTEEQSLTSMRIVDGRAASIRLKGLFGGRKIFTNPKDEHLLHDFFRAFGIGGDDIILDFFAGSGTTFQAVLEMNRAAGSNCRAILVQIPEELTETVKGTVGSARKITQDAIAFLRKLKVPTTIAEICKERLRRAGAVVRSGACHDGWSRDAGFRVLKIDSSGTAATTPHTADRTARKDPRVRAEAIRPDHSSEDLLFRLLVDRGIDLTLPIRRDDIGGKTVFFVGESALVACFDRGLTVALALELAKHRPLRVVFRNTSFDTDATRDTAVQILAAHCPGIDMRFI